LSPESRHLYKGGTMSKRAAQRLARHLTAIGYRVTVRRHRAPAGSFYSVQVVPKGRTARLTG